MKLSIFVLLFAASFANAQFKAIFALLKTLGVSQQLECTIPCILQSTNKLPCNGNGPAHTICANIDVIAEDTIPCTASCGSDKANNFVVELARWVCGQDGTAKVDGSKEEL